jgi:hypothetical protein
VCRHHKSVVNENRGERISNYQYAMTNDYERMRIVCELSYDTMGWA